MFNFFKKMEKNKKNSGSRKIDQSIEKTFESISSKIVVVSSMKLAAWKSYLIITFAAGFAAALIWGVYVSWYPIGKAADTNPTLHTFSAVGFHKANESFTTDVILSTSGKDVVAVQAILTFDPSSIEVISIDNSTTLFNLEVLKTMDNASGKVFLALAKPTPGVNSGSEKIATITAKAKKDFLEPGLNLTFSSTAKIAESSAAILNDGLGTNGLSRVYAEFPAVPAPTISITSPASGATLSGSVQISANAQSLLGTTGVDFFADGTLISADSSASESAYSVIWDASKATNGNHTLTAKACDTFARCTTSAGVTVSVNNVVPDTTPPTVSISSPQNEATVSGVVSIAATASDNVGVSKVEFLIDGASKSTDTSSPYAYSWDTSAVSDGSHSLTTKACDAAQNCATSSAVSVSLSNAASDKTPPVISDVNISNISANGATVTWTTDEPSTTQVSYGVDTSYGKTSSLVTALTNSHKVVIKRLKAGTIYHLQALSTDSAGNKAESSDYTFTTLSRK